MEFLKGKEGDSFGKVKDVNNVKSWWLKGISKISLEPSLIG